VCGGELAGILSHSVNCGRGNRPSVYAGMEGNRAWIEDFIGSAATISSSSRVTMLAMIATLITAWKSRL
jgi:hypothetical protein